MFQRILVANRGEIALRVIRACKELDIEVVAVYSQADRDAPYLAQANRAICIGKAASADSYLNRSRIIAAAEVADAQAIHPGYGFLSENPDFAEVCRSSGFEFIGPPHEAIRKMGLKTEAKLIAAAGPGGLRSRLRRRDRHRRTGDAARPRDRLSRIDQGRRRRRRQGHARLPRRVQPRGRASGRPQRGRGRLQKRQRLPRKVHRSPPARRGPDPRRLRTATSSTAGTAIARCNAVIKSWSRNRRRRPCPCRSARNWAKPPSGSPAPPAMSTRAPASSWSTPRINFYFIEVNARIQVEHPVTEMVTGIDLVKQQIKIAAGLPLPFRQEDIVVRGHSIECRINSEDPDHDFRPSPGRITALRVPGGPGVRWDSHIQVGYTVPPYYDSLLGKLIVHAPTRPEALATMRRALDELVIEGVSTTIPLHRRSFATRILSPGKSIRPGSSASSAASRIPA